MRISDCKIGYVKENLIKPFGFKGGYVSNLWQVVVTIGDGQFFATGLSIQSVLWSDAYIFGKYGQEKGDFLMYETTKYALEILKQIEFSTPYEATEKLFNSCYLYIKEKIQYDVKKTFILNALVSIDMALWLYYAKKKGITSFSTLTNLEKKQDKIALIPLITYTTSKEEIKHTIQNGEFFLKVKIGKEYEWDKQRIKEVSDIIKNHSTSYTKSKKPIIYLDANGRYENLDKLLWLIDYLDKEQILNDICIFEEPFSEEKQFDLSDIPCLFACDESAHSIKEVEQRNQQGYKALALKPAAKTLSESLKMLEYAKNNDMKTFVADLTVNPFLLELNRNVAMRIESLNCVNVGLLETNGRMNYVNWDKMISYHPLKATGVLKAKSGVFDLTNYEINDGGIFLESKYYNNIAKEEI